MVCKSGNNVTNPQRKGAERQPKSTTVFDFFVFLILFDTSSYRQMTTRVSITTNADCMSLKGTFIKSN